jgi:hypothetical protein
MHLHFAYAGIFFSPYLLFFFFLLYADERGCAPRARAGLFEEAARVIEQFRIDNRLEPEHESMTRRGRVLKNFPP